MTGHRVLERQRPETCLSDLSLDRWLAGELAGELAGRQGDVVRSHLRQCPTCGDRLRALQREPEILPGPVHPRPRWRRPIAAASGFAALAGAIALVAILRPSEPVVRAKGSLQLDVVVRRPDGRTEPLIAGDALAAGDVLRFVVSTSEPGYAFLIGLDAAGSVSAYFPAVGTPASLPAGRSQALPGSVVLDATLGAERFLLLHCNEATNVDVVAQAGRRALQAAAGDPRRVERLDLPCRQVGLTAEKVRRP
jgi:hypothetical protein